MFQYIFNRSLSIFISFMVIFFSSCDSTVLDELPPDLKTEQTKIGDYSLYTRTISGNRSDKIVLLSGLAGTTADWESMENELSKLGDVLNYDREGLGKSDWKSHAKDSRTIAKELHALLQAKNIKPPYMLVAHSLGGVHARVFASIYPTEVSGLVLVDPTPENLTDSLLATLPPAERDFILEQIRKDEEEALKQLPEGGIKEEFKAINTCYEQVRSDVWKTNVPIAVISSMKLENNDTPQSKEMAKRLRDQFLTQTETTKKQHYTSTIAGHFVQKDQPELVMKAVKWVVSQ
jgi:pimeloyl-ACP methyl ester carboxylesterase